MRKAPRESKVLGLQTKALGLQNDCERKQTLARAIINQCALEAHDDQQLADKKADKLTTSYSALFDIVVSTANKFDIALLPSIRTTSQDRALKDKQAFFVTSALSSSTMSLKHTLQHPENRMLQKPANKPLNEASSQLSLPQTPMVVGLGLSARPDTRKLSRRSHRNTIPPIIVFQPLVNASKTINQFIGIQTVIVAIFSSIFGIF